MRLNLTTHCSESLEGHGATVKHSNQSRWPARLFVLIALPITLLMAQIMPLGRMPDETAHVIRADSITHLQLIGRRDPGGSPVPRAYLFSDPVLSQIGYALPLPPGQHSLTADILSIQHNARWTKPQDIEIPNTASYSPVMYLPAALAATVPPFHAASGPRWRTCAGAAFGMFWSQPFRLLRGSRSLRRARRSKS